MGVCRGRIHEWYIGVKVQACVTWSSAKGTESPDLAIYRSNQAWLHASSFVLQFWTVRGESANHTSWQETVERTEAFFLVLLNPLSHGTIGLHATLRHYPLMALGP